MSEPRYFVDERVGAIAIRDRLKGVVHYQHGKWVTEKCPTCGQQHGGHWEIDGAQIAEALNLCDQLNAQDRCVEE